jgi:hypothetical protein
LELGRAKAALNLKFLEAGSANQFLTTSQAHLNQGHTAFSECHYQLETSATFLIIMSDNEDGGDGG